MENFYTRQSEIAKKIFSECKSLLVYDFETTGLSSSEDRAIEFSAMKYHISNRRLIEDSRITVYIKPDKPISEKITEITGYTNDFFEDKASEEQAFETIRNYIGDTEAVCGYNNDSFDNEFLKAMYERHSCTVSYTYSLDVLVAARQSIPKSEVENFKLKTIADYLGVSGDIDFHKAHDDVLATVRVLNALLEELLDDSKPSVALKQPTIFSIRYWAGYKGFSRIYVSTNYGSVYYDIRTNNWAGKDVNINELDMNYIVKYCYEKTGAKDAKEFARFKGDIKCSES